MFVFYPLAEHVNKATDEGSAVLKGLRNRNMDKERFDANSRLILSPAWSH